MGGIGKVFDDFFGIGKELGQFIDKDDQRLLRKLGYRTGRAWLRKFFPIAGLVGGAGNKELKLQELKDFLTGLWSIRESLPPPARAKLEKLMLKLLME